MWLITNDQEQTGFTLIELLIVIVLMGFVMSVSIASFITFNKSQALQTAQLNVVNILQQAKSQAESQVNPCSSLTTPESLSGYQVKITSTTAYELDVVCTPTVETVSPETLPATLSFAGSFPQTFVFNILQGGVTYTSNTITIQDQNNNTQTITVDRLGNIQYSH